MPASLTYISNRVKPSLSTSASATLQVPPLLLLHWHQVWQGVLQGSAGLPGAEEEDREVRGRLSSNLIMASSSADEGERTRGEGRQLNGANNKESSQGN